MSRNLASNDAFFDQLMNVIDGASASTVGGSTGSTLTGASTTNTNSATSGSTIPDGYCYFDEAAYRARGLRMTVTSADSESWITANNMKRVNGKLYVAGNGGMSWSFWKISDNQLTNASISCYQGKLDESGMEAFPGVTSGGGTTGGTTTTQNITVSANKTVLIPGDTAEISFNI